MSDWCVQGCSRITDFAVFFMNQPEILKGVLIPVETAGTEANLASNQSLS